MTDEKWKSKNGHPISSDVTDKLTKPPENVTCGDVSNVGDIQDAWGDIALLRKRVGRDYLNNRQREEIEDTHQALHRVEATLRALAQQQPVNAELLEALKDTYSELLNCGVALPYIDEIIDRTVQKGVV